MVTCGIDLRGFQTVRTPQHFRTQAFRTLRVSNNGPNLDLNPISNPQTLNTNT